MNKKIELQEAIVFLWEIIDDIDTYGDLAKDNEKLYRNLVEKRQRDRFSRNLHIHDDKLYMGSECLDKNRKILPEKDLKNDRN